MIREMYATHTRREIAEAMGCTEGQVRSRCWTLGLNTKKKFWTVESMNRLRDAYSRTPLRVDDLAAELGMSNVHRKARELGLTDKRRKRCERRKDQRITSSDADLRALQSEQARDRIKRLGHPRGALGMRHSAETLAKMSKASKARWESMSDDERAMHVLKTQTALTVSGKRNKVRGGATWKAGWRDIGGASKYYRSRWEANYARYLEWLKAKGVVIDWAHEPEVFWFEKIKRGARSYLPDFRIEFADGRIEYHEVKGWMDSRSKTKIRRMAKYHPRVVLVVIDNKAYRNLASAVGALVEGWE